MKQKRIASSLSGIAAAVIALTSLVATQVLANNQTQLAQSISEGIKSIDIVDGTGTTVASPGANFGALAFSFNTQTGTGTLGTASEKIRVSNPSSANTWTASIAGSSTTASWTAGANHYDFNDTSSYTDGGDSDSYGGQLTVNPSVGTLAGVSGCATSNVSLGSNNAFAEGTTDSITVASASAGAPAFCRWDITGVGLSQAVPAGQAAGSYTVSLALSIL